MFGLFEVSIINWKQCIPDIRGWKKIHGLSVENRKFLKIIDNTIYRVESRQRIASIPFREHRSRLWYNRLSALKRVTPELAKNSCKMPKRRCIHETYIRCWTYLTGIDTENKDSEEFKYLPISGIYQIPDQLIMVFDFSAQYEGLSFNKSFLQDLT